MRPEKGCKSCHCHIPGTVNNSICDQVSFFQVETKVVFFFQSLVHLYNILIRLNVCKKMLILLQTYTKIGFLMFQVTGVCPCKNGYMGRRCSHCEDGYMLISGRCISKFVQLHVHATHLNAIFKKIIEKFPQCKFPFI